MGMKEKKTRMEGVRKMAARCKERRREASANWKESGVAGMRECPMLRPVERREMGRPEKLAEMAEKCDEKVNVPEPGACSRLRALKGHCASRSRGGWCDGDRGTRGGRRLRRGHQTVWWRSSTAAITTLAMSRSVWDDEGRRRVHGRRYTVIRCSTDMAA